MSGFVQAYAAPTPRSKASGLAGIVYAGVLTLFAVTQLFTFEEFLAKFQLTFMPLGTGFGVLLAAVIVVAEVFALPSLLRMPLSVAFRWLSVGLAALLPLVWLAVSFWVLVRGSTTIGFLGTLVNPEPGVWAVAFSGALLFLSAWAVWGIWPMRQKAKRTVK